MDVRAVADDVQPLLVEVIDLALVSKQAHWVSRGPLFCPLGAALDELSEDDLGWADGLAQRLAAIGVPPDGRTDTVARQTPFRVFPSGFVDHAQVVAEFFAR